MIPLFSVSPRLRISVPLPFALIALSLLLFFAQCNARPFARSARAADCDLDSALDAVCRVHGPDGGLGTGCVFAVDHDRGVAYALTNAHVAGTRAGGQVRVEFWSAGHASRELPGVVDFATPRADVGYDLAVVAVELAQFDGLLPRVIPLQERGLQICPGDAVASVGCAKGAWPSMFRGHVARLDEANGLIEFVPPVLEGRSGSALLNADGSRIVGLVGWRDDEHGVGLAMNLEAVYRALAGEVLVKRGAQRAPSLVRAGELQLGGRLVPIPARQPLENCPDGNCWRPFRAPSNPQPPTTNPNAGAWPSKPSATSPAAPAVDTSKFALKSDVTALAGRVSTLEQHAQQAVTGDQLDHVLANAKADLQTALAGDVRGAVSDAAQQIKQDALARAESKAHQVVSDGLASKLAPLAEITTSVTAIAAKLGLPAAAAANPWLAPLVTGFSILSGLLGGAGLIRGKLAGPYASNSPKTPSSGGGSASGGFYHT